MENRNKIMQEKKESTVAALVRTVKFAVAVAELDDPDCKQVVLDKLIGELEKLAGRKKPCVDEGTCRNDEPTQDYGEPCNLDFGTAIRLLKDGHYVARRGWNGKGQYVELACRISYVTKSGDVKNASHQAIGNKALAFVGTSGVQLGWLASQADMLAEDWYVVK